MCFCVNQKLSRIFAKIKTKNMSGLEDFFNMVLDFIGTVLAWIIVILLFGGYIIYIIKMVVDEFKK